MQKIKFIYIIGFFAISLILLQSCEKTIDGSLPYEEKLVVKCILEEGQPAENIVITKTLPPMYTNNYSNEILKEIIVNNAVGYISDSERKYNLEYVGNSIYKAVDLVPKVGVTYQLYVTWNGHTATSQTYIPANPEIISLEVKQESKDFYGEIAIIKIKGARNTSYIPLSYSSGSNPFYNYGKVEFLLANSQSDTTNVTENQIWDYELNKYMTSEILSFPPEFYQYYNSISDGGKSPDGIFSSSGVNIKWNIKGEAIGLFLGQNTLKFNIEDYLNK